MRVTASTLHKQFSVPDTLSYFALPSISSSVMGAIPAALSGASMLARSPTITMER